MKKIKIPSQHFIFSFIILILVIIIAIFYSFSFKYYNRTQQASEKIKRYIQQVALEEIDIERAEQVIANLNQKPPADVDLSDVVSPFKSFEEEIEEIE